MNNTIQTMAVKYGIAVGIEEARYLLDISRDMPLHVRIKMLGAVVQKLQSLGERVDELVCDKRRDSRISHVWIDALKRGHAIRGLSVDHVARIIREVAPEGYSVIVEQNTKGRQPTGLVVAAEKECVL